ncbi:nicotinamide-nucleotide amidohydrolase family protein [Streptomyces calidiresistens]|uniref:Nicotinamide-nucleotide amidohydrolase family protein n=1 Tax=Streptomyces calidiresistens TaxID=1485586 RepID=A0A7W3T020_9ACTN|nr:nicotinamide-nucleotide amidohydrolase family protein [Streptomyces calidiresistens]
MRGGSTGAVREDSRPAPVDCPPERSTEPPPAPEAEEPAARLLWLLRRRGETVAAAESLTGGLVAAALTDAPGSSAAFLGSVTAYATAVKERVLGVDGALLEERGAVDPEVARRMALGVRDLMGADWGVATTGVAGPDPQDGHPPGTVFIAVAGPGATRPVARRLPPGLGERSRGEIREATTRAVLVALSEALLAGGIPAP